MVNNRAKRAEKADTRKQRRTVKEEVEGPETCLNIFSTLDLLLYLLLLVIKKFVSLFVDKEGSNELYTRLTALCSSQSTA